MDDADRGVRLRTIATALADSVARLGGTRSLTSQERRRVLHEAEESLVELSRLGDELDRRPSRPAEHIPGDAARAPLASVTAAHEALDRAEGALHVAVEHARAGGATWRQIGDALGVAAQTAHKRFDPGARRRHAAYMRQRYRRLAGTHSNVA